MALPDQIRCSNSKCNTMLGQVLPDGSTYVSHKGRQIVIAGLPRAIRCDRCQTTWTAPTAELVPPPAPEPDCTACALSRRHSA